MRTHFFSLALLIGALGVASVSACGGTQPPPSMAHHLVSQPLPDLDGKRTIGGTKISAAAYKGKIVVIKFFAKYCKPCKETLPAAQKIHAEMSNDVAFIGIAEDESAEDVEEVIKAFGLTFPVIHDNQYRLNGPFRVTEMPVTFVTDREGVVQWVGGPGQSHDALEKAIAALK